MDGILVCDLLKNHHDLHPIIQHYCFDALDIIAQEMAVKYYPKLCGIFMKYWDLHKAEMITIFTDCYPKDSLPIWVDHNKFREDMIGRMIDRMLQILSDPGLWIDDENPSATFVNFADTISFPITAEPMCYEISSRATDYLSINMRVDMRTALDATI